MAKVYKGIRIDEDLADEVARSRSGDETESDAYRRLIKAGIDADGRTNEAPSDAWTAYLDELARNMSEPPELDNLEGELEHLEHWRNVMLRQWQTPADYCQDNYSLGKLLTSRTLLTGSAESVVFAMRKAATHVERVTDDDYARLCETVGRDVIGPSGEVSTYCYNFADIGLLVRVYSLDWYSYDLPSPWRQFPIAWQGLTPRLFETMDDLLVTLARLNLDRDEHFFSRDRSYDYRGYLW